MALQDSPEPNMSSDEHHEVDIRQLENKKGKNRLRGTNRFWYSRIRDDAPGICKLQVQGKDKTGHGESMKSW